MKRALALVLVLAGCDPAEAQSVVPVYDPDRIVPVASIEFCALLARATCAVLRPCCEALPFAFDEQKCRITSRAQCETRRTRALELGLLYDDLQAGRCVAGTAILFPGCRSPDDPLASDVIEACRQTFHGTVEVGFPCDMASPNACAPPGLGERVSCNGVCFRRDLAREGESCIVSRCRAGLRCVSFARRSVCRPKAAVLGEPCSFGAAAECDLDADLFCDPARGICAPRKGPDETCGSTELCARGLQCEVDKNGSSRCAPGRQLFAPCADDEDCASKLCIGREGARICAPRGLRSPVASPDPRVDPEGYLTRVSAACSGLLIEGAGGLAPLVDVGVEPP